MIDQTHKDESGEGLMETLAVHPDVDFFVMGGRLRGGDSEWHKCAGWDVGIHRSHWHPKPSNARADPSIPDPDCECGRRAD